MSSLSFLLVVFLLLAPAYASLKRLTLNYTDGTIKKPDGTLFQAGGWNWGHWDLVLSTDGAMAASDGANIVRIILRWWGLYASAGIDSYLDSAPGHINPTNLQLLDWYIGNATAANLWINLAIDSNCGQNGQQDTNTSVYCTFASPSQNFWNNITMRTKFKDAWSFLVNRYKSTVTRLAWYEILPEPNPPGYSNTAVSQFYAEMIPILQGLDPVTPILIGPNGGYQASLISTVYNSSYSNVLYTADFLAGTVQNTTKMSTNVGYLTALRSSKGVPVFVQQVGITTTLDPTGALLSSALANLTSNNIGFTGWEYRGPVNGSYAIWYQNGSAPSGWSSQNVPYGIYKSVFASWDTKRWFRVLDANYSDDANYDDDVLEMSFGSSVCSNIVLSMIVGLLSYAFLV